MNDQEQSELFRSASQRIISDPNAELGLATIAKLRDAGYIAYFAGGCVRDALLGKTPKDYDVATNARPEQIRDLFGHRRTLAIGAAFGVITVLPPRQNQRSNLQQCKPVEVATFRSDGQYTDGRHPDSVQFSSPEEDALRRDFTINGMFFDPGDARVIDFVGGIDDLHAKQIRAIRDPDQRFHEDKLRLLRAVRFAATFGFELEPQTRIAIVCRAAEVITCSGERIGAEMLRIISSPTAAAGLRLLQETGLAAAIMPKIAAVLEDRANLTNATELLDFYQSQLDLKHDDPFSAKLSLIILCDLLQGSSKTEVDTYKLAAKQRLQQVVQGWHLSNEQRDAAGVAIEDLHWLLRAETLSWSQLQPLLVKRYSQTSIEVALTFTAWKKDYLPAAERIASALKLPSEKLNPQPLVTGNDLIEMGMKPGPKFKFMLQRIRDAQLDAEIETVQQAISLARLLQHQ